MTPSAETYTAGVVGALLGITGLCIAGAPWSVLAIAVAVAVPAYALVRHLDQETPMNSNVEWIKDAGLRVLWTFVQAFVAGLLVLDDQGLRVAFAAGVAAALSMLKSIVANTRPPALDGDE